MWRICVGCGQGKANEELKRGELSRHTECTTAAIEEAPPRGSPSKLLLLARQRSGAEPPRWGPANARSQVVTGAAVDAASFNYAVIAPAAIGQRPWFSQSQSSSER
jgi:hypothetical protein